MCLFTNKLVEGWNELAQSRPIYSAYCRFRWAYFNETWRTVEHLVEF